MSTAHKATSVEDDDIAYWNVNIPKEQWTEKCPDFLAHVDHYDRAQLATKDEDYALMTWTEVKRLVDDNRLEAFKRVPTDLRRYREYMAKVKDDYGSVTVFIMKERVKWQDMTPKSTTPFEVPDDVRILFNDWPYGIDRRIVHLVVWTKFGFEEDAKTGDLTPQARKQIDDYVTKTFRRGENPDHIRWFKNWAALKSVHAVEHIHVLLWDPDMSFIKTITHGDMPLATRIALNVDRTA